MKPSRTTRKPWLLPWLRLLRIPNLPSAISNILMGFLLAHQSWQPSLELGLLVLASSSLYLAGMILNDVFDLEIDRLQRPRRPLPSGEISMAMAQAAGWGLLAFGVMVAGLAGWVASQHAFVSASVGWRPGLIAAGLAVCIVLYDGPLKRTFAAPILMGLCRVLNVLLGASTFIALDPTHTSDAVLGLPILVGWVALSIGGLICGATWLGRNEADSKQNRVSLAFAGIIILASLIGLGATGYCPATFEISDQQKQIFPIFIALVSLSVLRRVMAAILSADPRKIQIGVVSVLRSLIFYDAGLCFLAAPGQIEYSLVVVSLLIPSYFLGRFIPST